MFEKILKEDLDEPFYGYFRFNISIKSTKLKSGKLDIDDDIKFYFWVNVAGITTITEDPRNIDSKQEEPHPIFKNLQELNYVHVNPKN